MGKKRATMQLLIVLCFVLVGVSDAHGLFWSPTSRARLAKESGWTTDATSIISEPMPEVASGRPYPGGRPFAEPGKSMTNVGPCGMETYDSKKTNWNMPAHSWGSTQAQYTSGDTIDVSWCVSNLADHGGLYSYRLCTDDDLVAKFTNETHTPNKQEMDQLETCFQKGILKCTDVPGQDCPVHPDCQDGWGCQQRPGQLRDPSWSRYLAQRPSQAASWLQQPTHSDWVPLGFRRHSTTVDALLGHFNSS